MSKSDPVKFNLGQIMFTQGVMDLIGPDFEVIQSILVRFLANDWGDLDKEDVRTNNMAVRNGGRLMGCYLVKDQKVWIITEADRSATTLLFPEEY